MQATTIHSTSAGQHLEQLLEAERRLIDALATAREAIVRCEHALHDMVNVRSTFAHSLGSPSPVDIPTQPVLVQRHHAYDSDCGPWRHAGDLTRREMEVLRLIASGLSNRMIADRLFISPRTVERHIANIYLKIDAHSKDEATAYAHLHKLA
jgi:DNA-binding NarL/FixJ family response regulator